jgi:hypothetical protein
MMRALTIYRPWAGLIAAGIKLVENRTWQPPLDLIGDRLAIHAGKLWDLGATWRCDFYGLSELPSDHPAQAIIATAHVVGVVVPRWHGTQMQGFEWVLGDERRVPRLGVFLTGPFGWVLEDVRALGEPIACRGYQRLWTVPTEIERLINRGQ